MLLIKNQAFSKVVQSEHVIYLVVFWLAIFEHMFENATWLRWLWEDEQKYIRSFWSFEF